jgi:c-di-GMP-binding flagellar brake protein YcgR
VDIRVRLRRVDDPENIKAIVRTYEMSEGGMSVYVPESLEMGAVVLAEFTLPQETTPLRLRAVVRNRKGFRFGLEFADIALYDRSFIVRFLDGVASAAESGAEDDDAKESGAAESGLADRI